MNESLNCLLHALLTANSISHASSLLSKPLLYEIQQVRTTITVPGYWGLVIWTSEHQKPSHWLSHAGSFLYIHGSAICKIHLTVSPGETWKILTGTNRIWGWTLTRRQSSNLHPLRQYIPHPLIQRSTILVHYGWSFICNNHSMRSCFGDNLIETIGASLWNIISLFLESTVRSTSPAMFVLKLWRYCDMDMIWAFYHLVLYMYVVVALSLCCQPVSPSLLLGCFLSNHVVLGLCAILHTTYQSYHTIHESIALIF